MKRIVIITPVSFRVSEREENLYEHFNKQLELLKFCINSISNQSIMKYNDYEIIQFFLINGIGNEIIDNFLKVNQNKYNMNIKYSNYGDNYLFPSKARNIILDFDLVKDSDYIFLLDSDDTLPPNRLLNAISKFEKYKDTTIAITSKMNFIDINGKHLDFNLDKLTSGIMNSESIENKEGWKTFTILDKALWFNLCGLCIKTKTMGKIKFKEIYTCEDMWLHSNLLSDSSEKVYRLLQDKENWGNYRIHQYQFSSGIKTGVGSDYIDIVLQESRNSIDYLLNQKEKDGSIDINEKKLLKAANEVIIAIRQNNLRKNMESNGLDNNVIQNIRKNIAYAIENSKKYLDNNELPKLSQTIIANEYPELIKILYT